MASERSESFRTDDPSTHSNPRPIHSCGAAFALEPYGEILVAVSYQFSGDIGQQNIEALERGGELPFSGMLFFFTEAATAEEADGEDLLDKSKFDQGFLDDTGASVNNLQNATRASLGRSISNSRDAAKVEDNAAKERRSKSIVRHGRSGLLSSLNETGTTPFQRRSQVHFLVDNPSHVRNSDSFSFAKAPLSDESTKPQSTNMVVSAALRLTGMYCVSRCDVQRREGLDAGRIGYDSNWAPVMLSCDLVNISSCPLHYFIDPVSLPSCIIPLTNPEHGMHPSSGCISPLTLPLSHQAGDCTPLALPPATRSATGK
jgi:hypothetical protein